MFHSRFRRVYAALNGTKIDTSGSWPARATEPPVGALISAPRARPSRKEPRNRGVTGRNETLGRRQVRGGLESHVLEGRPSPGAAARPCARPPGPAFCGG